MGVFVGIGAVILVGVGEPTNGAEASGGVLALFWLFFLVGVLAHAGYYTYFHGSSRGQTPGKMLLGIRVRAADFGGRLGYVPALGRYLVGAVLWWVPFGGLLDGLWPLWDAKNQALHDKVAGSVVVRT